MRHFHWLRGVYASVLAAGVLVLAGCSHEAPEAHVRGRVEALQSAIDARDVGAVHALLADDFIGNDGLDKQGARRLATGLFLRYRNVGLRLGPVDVRLRGDADATVRFTVLATGGSGGLLPDSGQVYAVETGWRWIDGAWRLRSAQWRAAR